MMSELIKQKQLQKRLAVKEACLTKKNYIKHAKKIHGNKFDYSLLNNPPSRLSTFRCKTHNHTFTIHRNKHLFYTIKGGCTICQNTYNK